MISTFHGIEVGKRGMQAHQQGMHVIEHNVSNANTEGYSRQRINFETFDPLYIPGLNRDQRPGQIGTGTVVQKIERIRNSFLDDQIMSEVSNKGYWEVMQFNLRQVEHIHSEPSDQTIRTNMDKFWKAWQDLNNNPRDLAARAVVKETATTLARSINATFDRLKGMQDNIDTQIKTKVETINNLARQLAEINEKILQSQQVGDNPNDLLDRRDKMVESLSKMTNVNVVRRDPDEFFVYVGSQYLVQGAKFRTMEAKGNPAMGGYADVRWSDDASPVKLTNGELKALVNVRDDVLDKQITKVDNLTANLVDLVNEGHFDGFGLNFKTGLNFFKRVALTENRNGNFDFNGDGTEDKTILFKISGTKKLDADAEVGSAGQLNFGPAEPGGRDVLIDYTAKDKVRDVIDRINKNQTGVVAYLNHRGRLTVKASLPSDKRNMNFVIRHVEDSGDLFVGIGGLLRQRRPQGAFDWNAINQVNKLVGGEKDYTVTPQYHPSRWLDVDDAIKRDLNNIAASKGIDTDGDDKFDKSNGLGDGNNALTIAAYRYNNGMIGENSTFDEFFTGLIGQLGADSRDAKEHYEKSELVMKALSNERKSVSGVSMDAELAQMVMFQHGYNASARLIKTFDQMLETVIHLAR